MPPVDLRPRVGGSSGNQEPETEEEEKKRKALEKRRGEKSSSSDVEEEELNTPDSRREVTASSSSFEKGEKSSVVLIPNKKSTQEKEELTPSQEESSEAALARRKEQNKEALDSLFHSVVERSSAEQVKPRGSIGRALEAAAKQQDDKEEQEEEEKNEGEGGSLSAGTDLHCTFTRKSLQEGEKTPTPEEGEESDEEEQERRQRDFLVSAVPKRGFVGKPEELSKDVSVSASEDSEEEREAAKRKREKEQEELLAIPDDYFREVKKADPPEGTAEYRAKFRREELSFQRPEAALLLSNRQLARQEELERKLEKARPEPPPEPKGPPPVKARPKPKAPDTEALPPWREPKPPWKNKGVELKTAAQAHASEILPVLTRDRRKTHLGREAAYYGREELIPQPKTPPRETPSVPKPPKKRPPPPSILKKGSHARPKAEASPETCLAPLTEEEELQFEEWKKDNLLEISAEDFDSLKEFLEQQKAIAKSLGVPERASDREPKRKASEESESGRKLKGKYCLRAFEEEPERKVSEGSEPEKRKPRLKKEPNKGYVEQLQVAQKKLKKAIRSVPETEKECEQIERETRKLLREVKKDSAKKRKKRKASGEEAPEPPARKKLRKKQKQKKTSKKEGEKANPPTKKKKKEKREPEARGEGEIDYNEI